MNTARIVRVINESQARQITGGRKPLVPVEYETAIKFLTACLTLDEAKIWDAKADALAAWAKIYRDDDVSRKAKMLKLHAYRRMGQLATELRPHVVSNNGRSPGPLSLLIESGMTRNAAGAATALSRMKEPEFARVLKKPAAPTTITKLANQADPLYGRFSHAAQNLRGICRQNTAAEMARAIKSLSSGELATAQSLCADISEWLDDLDMRLKTIGGK